jgi:hypothetical protein
MATKSLIALSVIALGIAFVLTPVSRSQERSGIVIESSGLQVAAGDTAEGEVLLSLPARYAETGRLVNEVRIRRRPLSIPAGTPVFAMSFNQLGTVWCAVSQWGNRLRSICFERTPGGPGNALVGVPYAVAELPSDYFRLESAPQIEVDAAANPDFPPIELVYVLHEWQRNQISIWKALRVNGTVYQFERVLIERGDSLEDRGAQFPIGSRIVRVSPVGEESARVEIVR